MTLKEYLKYNRIAISFSLRLTGVIFTVLILIFTVPSNAFRESSARLLILFVISIICGNTLSLVMCCLKMNSTFQQTKRNYKLYDTISSELVDKFSFKILPKTDISKNKFLEIQIVGKQSTTPILLEMSEKGEVWITIVNKLDNILDFPKRSSKIDRKYRNQKITLTGWGFRKTMHQKVWNKLTKIEIEKEISDLFNISDNENIKY